MPKKTALVAVAIAETKTRAWECARTTVGARSTKGEMQTASTVTIRNHPAHFFELSVIRRKDIAQAAKIQGKTPF